MLNFVNYTKINIQLLNFALMDKTNRNYHWKWSERVLIWYDIVFIYINFCQTRFGIDKATLIWITFMIFDGVPVFKKTLTENS